MPASKRESSPSAETIEQELDRLCRDLNGSVCADPLSKAKAALAGRDYQGAAEFVGNTWEVYRQRRWKVLRHHPESSGALSAEDRFLATAKVKAERILGRLEAVLEGLHKLAAAEPASEPAGFAPSADLLAEYSAAQGADAEYEVILKYFAVSPVSAEQDLSPGGLFSLESQGESMFCCNAPRGHPSRRRSPSTAC